jgi:hypothetical protein
MKNTKYLFLILALAGTTSWAIPDPVDQQINQLISNIQHTKDDIYLINKEIKELKEFQNNYFDPKKRLKELYENYNTLEHNGKILEKAAEEITAIQDAFTQLTPANAIDPQPSTFQEKLIKLSTYFSDENVLAEIQELVTQHNDIVSDLLSLTKDSWHGPVKLDTLKPFDATKIVQEAKQGEAYHNSLGQARRDKLANWLESSLKGQTNNYDSSTEPIQEFDARWNLYKFMKEKYIAPYETLKIKNNIENINKLYKENDLKKKTKKEIIEEKKYNLEGQRLSLNQRNDELENKKNMLENNTAKML